MTTLTVRQSEGALCAPAAAPQAALHVETMAASGAAEWDRFVYDSGGSIFHTSAWMSSVAAAFGHKPHYLAARRGDAIAAGLPLVEMRSLLAGTLLISVPYAVYGGPIGSDRAGHLELQDAAYGLADRLGACTIELRSERATWAGVPVTDRYVTFRGALPERAGDCLGALPRKARAAARTARERHGFRVSHGKHHLRTVWELYARNMRRLASLNYPFAFFEELVARTPQRHFVSVVLHDRKPVAGLVTFVYHGQAMPYFVGADKAARNLGVYNYIYLTAMERAVELGCHTFDFGRSRRDNSGACAFKKNQGFQPAPLAYQVYTPPGRKAPDLTPGNPRYRLARRVWPALPGTITRRLGAWLSRHVTG